MDIIICVIITIVSLILSFVAKGLIDKYCDEDEKKETVLKEKEEFLKTATKKEKFELELQLKKIKSAFKPKFDLMVFITIAIPMLLLYLFVFCNSVEEFIVYSFVTFIISICAFTDIKRCSPNWVTSRRQICMEEHCDFSHFLLVYIICIFIEKLVSSVL
jgi:hypothetical protein